MDGLSDGYLSFLPSSPAPGSVMYVTSPHEPGLVVGSLCHKHASESIRLGKYIVHGDKVRGVARAEVQEVALISCQLVDCMLI